MLAVDNLTCGYGSVLAVSGLSFSVQQGEILALLGSNGAGKTSTIMATMGHVRISAGKVLVANSDITHEDARQRPALGMAVVPEGRKLFNDLTVDENLTVGGYTRTRAQARLAREHVYDLFPRLFERRSQLAGSMSGGEQQMLAIGRALMVSPKILLIDELSLGLAPRIVDLCMEAVVRLRTEGLAIVLVEQNTDRALEIADHVALLSSGHLVARRAAGDIRGDDSFFEAYLGLDTADPAVGQA